MAIVVVGMLDEREEALTIILDRIRQRGHRTCLIDISVGAGAIGPALQPDVTCQELAELAKERAGLAVGQGVTPNSVVTEGLKAKIHDLYGCGQLEGMVAITGMTGALISLPAMKELPFGVPKLLISGATGQPVHAAKFGDYFARRDITVMHTVVDTVGMNPLVRSLALNGADAISGMVEGGPRSLEGDKPSRTTTRSFRSTRWGSATKLPWISRPREPSRPSSTSSREHSASTFSGETGTRGRIALTSRRTC